MVLKPLAAQFATLALPLPPIRYWNDNNEDGIPDFLDDEDDEDGIHTRFVGGARNSLILNFALADERRSWNRFKNLL